MPLPPSRSALKAVAGFAVGVALWLMLTPVYDRIVVAGAQALLRAFERPPVTRLRPAEDGYVTVDRSDFDPRSKKPAVPIRDLTFNFVLIVALFAASTKTFSDRNMGGFVAASATLAVTHVLAAVATVMSIYVAKLGPWSRANYGEFARNFWGVSNHFYRLVLMYAIAFGLWWVFRDTGSPESRTKPPKKGAHPRSAHQRK